MSSSSSSSSSYPSDWTVSFLETKSLGSFERLEVAHPTIFCHVCYGPSPQRSYESKTTVSYEVTLHVVYETISCNRMHATEVTWKASKVYMITFSLFKYDKNKYAS